MNTSDIRFKIQVHINNKILFGKVVYKDKEPISKILVDLQKIKILPDSISASEVTFTDINDNIINKNHYFSSTFDDKNETNIVIINVPEELIDLKVIQAQIEKYVKKNRQNKKLLKGLSEADNFVKNLRPIFSSIQESNYNEAKNLCDNEEYAGIINDFSNQHRQLTLLNQIYEQFINDVIESKEINLSLYANYGQLEDRYRDKIWEMLKKYNHKLTNIKEDHTFAEIKNGIKEKQINDLQAKNKQLASELDKKEVEVKELQRQLHNVEQDYKARLKQSQENYQQKMTEMWTQINDLKDKQSILEHKYDSAIDQNTRERSQFQDTLKEKEAEIAELLLKKGNNEQHVSNYVKYFTDKEVILNELALNIKFSNELFDQINRNIGEFKGFTLLYKSDRYSSLSDKFHKFVDFKENVFIICKTKQGKVFGGFSSLPFQPNNGRNAPHLKRNQKAFLFNIHADELNYYPLKPACESIEYCEDFIIFGNEQICIDRQKCKVESLFVTYKTDYLHFSDPKNIRQSFLSIGTQKISKADLQGYEIYQIVT